MQPFGRTECDRCGQLDAMHAADPFEVVLLQPPSLPTVTTPVTCPRAAQPKADTRSSTWQNCQRGRDPRSTSSRGASK